jgi:DNA-binding IclR family transcriptional regulator
MNTGPGGAIAVACFAKSRPADPDGPVGSRTAARGDRVPASGRLVRPLARALDLLSAFSPQDKWLGTRDIAERTGFAVSTVTRIARTLTELGYLHFTPGIRGYRLSAAVLALGYAAIANSSVQRYVRPKMRAFASEHKLHVSLCARDRLDVVIVESCSGELAPLSLNLQVASRVGLASSPMGWAFLAALPEVERYYLMENLERRVPREWPRVQRRLGEAVAQVHELGYCASFADRNLETGTIAAPLLVEGEAPLVLCCIGASSQITRARVGRVLAPRLLALLASIQSAAEEYA